MPNNIAVAVTADVADLQVKRAIMSAELKVASKDLSDFAKTASTSGLTDQLKTSMLASADAVTRLKNQVGTADSQLKAMGTEARAAGGAMEGLHMGSAGVTRELIVMGREASRGNFSRMAGSATILLGRMNLLTPAILGVAAPFVLLTAAVAGFLVEAEQGSQQLAKFDNALEATNGYAGVTISQLHAMSAELASWGHEGIGTATKELMALAASGQFSGQTLQLVGADATRMSQLTGESADKWNTDFEKMGDGVTKFAAEYQARYGQLTTAQFQYIQQLELQGQKETAEYALAKDIYEYLGNQAPQHLGVLERALHSVATAASAALEAMRGIGRNDNADQIASLQKQIARYERDDAAQGGVSYDAPLAALQKQLAAVQATEAAQQKQAAIQAQTTATQKEGVAAAQKLSEQFEASKTSGEKLKKTLADINVELAKAVAADPGNKAKYEQEAAAARSQAVKSDTPKGPKDNAVAEWESQLQAKLISEQNFFAESTSEELSFWQSKLALTQSGSRDWLAISTKIYDAQKTLAHKAYDDQLATLNEQLEADKDNWGKEQADWNAKLAAIAQHFSKEDAQYKEAYKGFEAAQREHQEKMAQAAAQAAEKALSDLKANLESQKAIREQDAQAQEALIEARARGSINPLADVQAAQQIAEIHQQLLQQQLADDMSYQAARDATLQQAIDNARAKYTEDSENYKKAVQAKSDADNQWANQFKQLQSQLAVQSQQDGLKMAQAWTSAINPMVQSFGSGVEGMIRGTETLQQAMAGIGTTILNVIVTSIERWVTAQIVAMVTGQAVGKSTAASQIATNVALAGSGGVASMAAAPFPLDMGAPAFGASMAAAAAAMGSVASFDVGTNYVPNDMLAQIHQGERIVPAADNAALMSAVNGQDKTPGARPSGSGDDGALHVHIHAVDAPSFKKMLENNSDHVVGMLRTAIARGRAG